MYAKIIVPIDLSHVESGKKAITIAQKLLDKDGKIYLVNVVEDIPTYVAAELPVGMLQESKDQALAELKTIANAAGINANIEVRSGRAASSIMDAAEENEANLIIIASHRPGLSDYFLGSTASRVVRHAQCPVFVDR
jgi:universal stress protein F